jgi:hypothetical protein
MDWHCEKAPGEVERAALEIVLEGKKRMSAGRWVVGRVFALFQERYLGKVRSP